MADYLMLGGPHSRLRPNVLRPTVGCSFLGFSYAASQLPLPFGPMADGLRPFYLPWLVKNWVSTTTHRDILCSDSICEHNYMILLHTKKESVFGARDGATHGVIRHMIYEGWNICILYNCSYHQQLVPCTYYKDILFSRLRRPMDACAKNVEAPCLENEFLKQDWLIPESKFRSQRENY